MAEYPYQNANRGLQYPFTKMNFRVNVDSIGGDAAFSQVTGLDATVDVIEFRQGNANSLAPVKIPGLVKHGNVTLKYGYTKDSKFKEWIIECVSESHTKAFPRHNVSIELIDIHESTPNSVTDTVSGSGTVWVLTNAWVTKYTASDLDAKTSDVAIESVEIAYEELTIPK